MIPLALTLILGTTVFAALQASPSVAPAVHVGPVSAAPERLIYAAILCPSGNSVAQRYDRWRYTKVANEPRQLRIVKSVWRRKCY